MDFKRQLEDKTQTVNKWLEQLAPRGSGIYSEIFDAANYSVNAGEKDKAGFIPCSVRIAGGK